MLSASPSMDPEYGNDDESEEMCIEDEDYTVDSVFEQESCGICIDIVIDRGVLDCCDHWFCFACIDNWATITNFCPICKNEFQHITCLPVYDTIRSMPSEEHLLSRNWDWSIQEKNNALSFPSYYISEDAVKCLGHDGCKIHTLQGTEEDLSFDTSIACDSCDIWYHAICVGFNPQFASENSWLCPRCINNEVLQKSDSVLLRSPVKYSASQTNEIGWSIDSSLSRNVSVSVADTGETAVVVSLIAGKQKTDCERSLFDRLDSNVDLVVEKSSLPSDNETSETDLPNKDGSCLQVSQNHLIFSDYKEQCTNTSDIDNRSEYFFDLLPEIMDVKPYDDFKEATMSSFSHDDIINDPRNDITESEPSQALQDAPFSLRYSEENDEGENNNYLETRADSIYSDSYTDTSFVFPCTSEANEEPNHKICADTCLAATSTLLADNMVISCNKDMWVDIFQKSREGCNSTAEHGMNKVSTINMNENNGYIWRREQGHELPSKKPKLDKKFKPLPAGNKSVFSSLEDGSQLCSRNMRGASLRHAKQEENESPDIMSIIQESDCKAEAKAGNNVIDRKGSASGLRVKKIMRRVGEKSESFLAQELGKEIREVVQKKTLKNIGKNEFDEKLLAAFRAAMVRPQTEMARSGRVLVGSKKSLIVKGGKRENLTKKIYGTSSGRRRHAWARDLEIEFWKHRCSSAQYEKVETLQSVLELLKKATNPNWNSYMECHSQEESANSILSRVYIADATVFPRKDDIKPLSAMSESFHVDNHILEEQKSSANAAVVSLIDNISAMKGFPGETLSRKVNSGKGAPDTFQCSGSNFSKESVATSKEHSCQSYTKSDKRKWALEILARKTASENLNVNKGQENGSLLKGNFPLLAQLPQDMRPILASSRHNKVSASIRQAQLYRITEHYLRRANVPIIRRTAETELAVADAINVEKEILERSNSKLVYLNLCSQAVSQVAKMQESAEASISNSPVATNEVDESSKSGTETDNKLGLAGTNLSSSILPTSKISIEISGERNYDPKAHEWGNVEALKLTGLFSNSGSNRDQCGQGNIDEIMNFDDKPESAEINVCSTKLHNSEVSNEVSGATSSHFKACGWNNVEEALKMAGVFSDSPPSSPYYTTKDSNVDKCGQENVNKILNFDNKPESAETIVCSSTLPISEISIEVSGETNSYSKACGWSNVEEALKMAGLFSDSPLSSPYATEDFNGDDCAQENVVEILNHDAQDNIQDFNDTAGNISTTQSPGKAACDSINMAVKLAFDFSNSLEQQKECSSENCNSEVRMDICIPTKVPEMGICDSLPLEECEGRNEVPLISPISEKLCITGEVKNLISTFKESKVSVIETHGCYGDPDVRSTVLDEISARRENLETQTTGNLQINPIICDNIRIEDIAKSTNDKSDHSISVSKKVEAYIKEHIRPLCKSRIITVEQYRWAVGKTLVKVMSFHQNSNNANFLIREGEKVKRLAEKYVEAAQKQKLEVNEISH